MEILDIDIKQEILSKPDVGKTMLGNYKRYAIHLYEAHRFLVNELDKINLPNNDEWVFDILCFTYSNSYREFILQQKNSIGASYIILNWICARILEQIPSNANFCDSEKWLHGEQDFNYISNYIDLDKQEYAINILNKLNISELLGALPYLTEVFETGFETAIKTGKNRDKKKRNGIYYTPTDVIEFMISHTLVNNNIKNESLLKYKWFDPAVGTGSFLVSLLNHLYISNYNNDDYPLLDIAYSLFGSDISPQALQSSVYIIALNYLSNDSRYGFKEVLNILSSNFALVDSTKIINKKVLNKTFPAIGEKGVDFIISNPPYSKKTDSQLNLRKEKKSKNIYPEFINLFLNLTKTNGGGSMVVPLSLTSNSESLYNLTRNKIQGKNGLFEFWNFDRTPDSLFGDDVKTRNTILFYSKNYTIGSKPVIFSTYLHRWSSRNRHSLFDSMLRTKINTEIDISSGVPKVGDVTGMNILEKLNQNNFGNLKELIKRGEYGDELITKTTAYNWIPVELNLNGKSEVSSSKVFWSLNKDFISMPVIYALLNSKITYWLWRIWGDGFHLTNRFILSLPFGENLLTSTNIHELNNLGLELWDSVKSNVIVNRNAGKSTYTYCPLHCSVIINKIDELLLEYFSLPKKTNKYLANFIENLIIAGRENELDIYKKLNYSK